MSNKEYSVLYTHQKTKKHKIWQDGILIFYKNKNKATLYEDGSKIVLDTVFVQHDKICVGMEIESDRYLITVEEDLGKGGNDSTQVVSTPHTVNSSQNQNTMKRKNREFCPPKFVSTEKALSDNEPLDKRIKIQDKDILKSSQTTDQELLTKNQFFTLYSKKKQNLMENKNFDQELCFNFSKPYKEPTRTNKQNIPSSSNCNKRDTSQILALFSSNNISQLEEQTDPHSEQLCPQSSSDSIVNYNDNKPTEPSYNNKAWFSQDVKVSASYDCGNNPEIAVPSVLDNDVDSAVLPSKTSELDEPIHYKNTHKNQNSTFGVNFRRGIFKATQSNNLFQVPDVDISIQKIPSPIIYDAKRNAFVDNNCYRKKCTAAINSNQDMARELSFPTSKDCEDKVKPCRQVIIPFTFDNFNHYQQTLKAALKEHLNIILFELAQNYHAALKQVDLTQYSTVDQGMISDKRPSCSHGISVLRSVKKEGPNKGRLFYCCPSTNNSQCKFFQWVNEFKNTKQSNKPSLQVSKPQMCSADEVTAFFKSQGLSLHCECRLIIKRRNHSNSGKSGKHRGYKYSKKRMEGGDNLDSKKSIFLELSTRQRSHTYNKDDIWIVSTSLLFDQRFTFVAKSTYYGPYSSGELEISPIRVLNLYHPSLLTCFDLFNSGYYPSNWHSGDVVYALQGCNAGNELTCIENIDMHVNKPSMPLLDSLLYRPCHDNQSGETSGQQSFTPPLRSAQRILNNISLNFAVQVAEEMIHDHHLNTDQRSALLNCAHMFTDVPSHISLIHGVFGAGKSYLLAVTILYLVKLFRSSRDDKGTGNISQFKILVSSTTNVAVDRILLVLLDLGFDEFVRVGSVRKIAKQLLPYTIQGSGSHTQELKDLQAMLKEDLEPSEKQHIRKSIEKLRLGENKKKLDRVQVVGVTCAACVFPCLEKMKFCVVLLDECSQMTEPTALLPLARFGCQKLILVGDPKQLSPTIQGSTQGSQLEQYAGLEQTLFDRLTRMGYSTTLLRTQYRCHPAISAVANSLFYEGNLVDGVTPEERAPLVDFAPTLGFYDVSQGKEKCGRDGSYYNDQEAKFVVFLIGCFLESGIEPEQLGVITLYKSQLITISWHLSQSQSASCNQLKAVQISTVDAFQGGEKDVILLSCVRTEHVGFIDCGRRTNVALTRAKRHLLIVGNQRMLSSNEMWRKVIQQCRGQVGGVTSADDFEHFWQTGDHENSTTVDNENGHAVSPMTGSDCSSSGDFLPFTDDINADTTEPLWTDNSVDSPSSEDNQPEFLSIDDRNNVISSPSSDDNLHKFLSIDDKYNVINSPSSDDNLTEILSIDNRNNVINSPSSDDNLTEFLSIDDRNDVCCPSTENILPKSLTIFENTNSEEFEKQITDC